VGVHHPSVGRGASIGLLHAVTLRDVLRDGQEDDPMALARRWQEATAATVDPWLRDTIAFDRHRSAEIDARSPGDRTRLTTRGGCSVRA